MQQSQRITLAGLYHKTSQGNMKNNEQPQEKHEKQLNKKIMPQGKPNSLVTNRVTKIGRYDTQQSDAWNKKHEQRNYRTDPVPPGLRPCTSWSS